MEIQRNGKFNSDIESKDQKYVISMPIVRDIVNNEPSNFIQNRKASKLVLKSKPKVFDEDQENESSLNSPNLNGLESERLGLEKKSEWKKMATQRTLMKSPAGFENHSAIEKVTQSRIGESD